jgi:HAD-superfamily hydrolase, subfamily IIB
MIKLIVSDLDGTLLGPDGKLSSFTREAIYRAIKNGILFTVSSGRFYEAINDDFIEFDKNMILMCHNGAWIQRAGNGEVLYSCVIPQAKIRRFVSYVKQKIEAGIYLCKGDRAVLDDPKEYMVEGFRRVRINYDYVEKLEDYSGDICRIGLILPEQFTWDVIDDLKREFTDDFEITLGGQKIVDINKKNITKGSGVETLQRLFKISPDETMAFGDYYNDISMFKRAYYSFAMENSPEDVKREANFIAGSNKDDGAALEILKVCR